MELRKLDCSIILVTRCSNNIYLYRTSIDVK